MCNFFSVTSDGKGNINYFNWEQRKQIVAKKLTDNGNEIYPDSHTSINSFYGFVGETEDTRNKYEYNPLTKVFTIDAIGGKDDSKIVEKQVRKLDFKTIVEPLIIKPIVNPLKISPPNKITEAQINLLKEWDSVRDSARDSIWDSIRDSVGNSILDSVMNSVWDSVGNSIWDSVMVSVWDSVGAYISSFFYLKNRNDLEHKPYKNSFQPAIDLWEIGLVPILCGNVWRLHGGADGKILYTLEGR